MVIKIKKKLKIGFIGLGGRGYGLMGDMVLPMMEDIDVIAVCDLHKDLRERAAVRVKELRDKEPLCTGDYHEVLGLKGIDAVIVSTSWRDHIKIAIDAMKAGIPVGVEVGGAYSIDQCWQLVHTQEKTGTPCMLMENCCYGREEMMVLNMVKTGVLGKVVHCEGGYHHDLRTELANSPEDHEHYRLYEYIERNGENYPTHELGPIAKVLNINRGNRMLTLTSMASKARGLHEYILAKKEEEYPYRNTVIEQGDVVTTTIKCAHGETITLTLDTTTPTFYTRGFRVYGTKGRYVDENQSLFLDSEHTGTEFDWNWKPKWGNIEEYREKYDHPIWKDFLNDGVRGGHGGMDYLVFRTFFESVMKGEQPPIDIYDMAAWMCITALSEQSIAMGGMPVPIPDFTNGKWVKREPAKKRKYSLEDICEGKKK